MIVPSWKSGDLAPRRRLNDLGFSPCGANLPAVLLQIRFVFIRIIEKREAQAEILAIEL